MATTAQPNPAAAVLESREGAILTLTLNRPDKLNALNVELVQALLRGLERAAQDDSIRCVILTGAGRAFCSGGDLNLLREVRTRNATHELEALLRAGIKFVLAMRDLPKPVVGAINGPAAGAGMNVALACDVRIASDRASFGQTFAKVGLFPDYGGTWLLPRIAGAAAQELFYSGDMISAQEAQRLGIVNHVVPHDALEPKARALAEKLAAAPPVAARGIKQSLFGAEREALERALEFEASKQIECFASEDSLEGFNAFFEKRQPKFKGK